MHYYYYYIMRFATVVPTSTYVVAMLIDCGIAMKKVPLDSGLRA